MLKVVVVEDEELVRKGIVLAVDWSALDCVVVGEAANGKEGLEIIRQYRPDLVITDIRMPVMDGLEMCRILTEEGVHTAFIILTAYSDFAYAHSAIKLGVADYLLKPFADGELEQAILSIKEKLAAPPEDEQSPLLRTNQEPGSKSKYVEQAIDFIRNHYSDPQISISRVAAELDISESYLSRVFKKETDYTFNAYLTNYRIHVALRLLKDYRVKVYEVAQQVGYLDTTYFSTLFKKYTGLTPSDYQDRCN